MLKTQRYTIVHPNGEVMRCTVPHFFGSFEVAQKLRHSVVFLFIPKGHSMHVDNQGAYAEGPAWAYIRSDSKAFLVPWVPTDTDSGLCQLLRDAGGLNTEVRE